MTYDEWEKMGERLYGKDKMKWKFRCPSCGWVASVQDYKDAGAPDGVIGFSCIGRYMGPVARDAFSETGIGPCNYAGGGLIGLNPVDVEGVPYFQFADAQGGEDEQKI
ncbi:hypothetical protein GF374_03410 [Candidatus Woesearchaeota archaeon]|nr:hypothetical protein [Candidatus Woesearchaeota archaeon]